MKKNIDIGFLVRENIRKLKPYSSARDEFKGKADIFLDANENPYPNYLRSGSTGEDRSEPPMNRYPDPLQSQLKEAIGKRMSLQPKKIFLGNGSDEAIDLLLRAFCEPGQDRALICSPTYGMYKVSAGINDVQLIDVPLTQDFQPDIPSLQKAILDYSPKLIFLCSPNNPTGNAMDKEAVEAILKASTGLVIIDEAYSDFAPDKSFLDSTEEWPQLVVLKTFSKAWGMAGLRLGMAVGCEEVIDILNKIKPPYNLSSIVQEVALEQISECGPESEIGEIIAERNRLRESLTQMEGVLEVFPSDANFLLVRFRNSEEVFNKLRDQGIVVRDRSSYVKDALRITVGTPQENQALLYQIESIFTPNFSIH